MAERIANTIFPRTRYCVVFTYMYSIWSVDANKREEEFERTDYERIVTQLLADRFDSRLPEIQVPAWESFRNGQRELS